MAGIVIKPRARILHGHDWVFSSEVLKVFGKPPDGAVISLKDGRDHLIGSAIYNSKSQIVARRFSRRKQDLDVDFFTRRIAQAAEYRLRRGIDPDLCRVVWSESDGLPGLILDRYNDFFVLQTLTLAMDTRKESIAKVIVDLFDAKNVIERNDTPIRRSEGLDPCTGVLEGAAPPGPIIIEIKGTPIQPIRLRSGQDFRSGQATFLQLEVDLLAGQKTGLYLDQLPNYSAIAEHAKDRRVLDCFANQGAFALSCARAGAPEVTAVEASAANIVAAKRNAERNKLSAAWIEGDVFQFLRAAEKSRAQYDLIILDPPSFAKTRGGLRDALRGYRELHVRAFNLLSKDGLLATFSCSHHVNEAAFAQVIGDALVDARRSARKIRRFEQSPDHPVLPTIPETEYFKGLLLEMMPGR